MPVILPATAIPAPATTAIALAAVALFVLLLALRNQRRHHRAVRRRLRELSGEEQRMFAFLHDLGQSIENEPSPAMLSRLIVDGINRVVNARGGAIYLLGTEPGYLHPAYVSEDCPPLIGIPVEVRKKAARDPRTLESHVRLSRVAVDEGILGHCLTLGAPVHIKDVKNHPSLRDAFTRYSDDVAVMLSPLRHAGKDLGVLAVARIHREAHEKRMLEGELHNAREVQRILMPQVNPSVAGFRICGTNLPARIISGDYYDYLNLGDGKFGVVIADVSGKGVSAGLTMAMYRSVLRSIAPGHSSPAAVLAALNTLLFPDIREDMFVSMIYGILDETTGHMVIARAGHDAPLLFRRSSGQVEILRPPGLALGIDPGNVFQRVTKDLPLELLPGDCLLLYTDGVREAVNPQDEEFGVERMAETFRLSAPVGAPAVLSQLQDDLRHFTGNGPQTDDITLVAIERNMERSSAISPST